MVFNLTSVLKDPPLSLPTPWALFNFIVAFSAFPIVAFQVLMLKYCAKENLMLLD